MPSWPETKTPRALVVDDNEDARKMYRHVLEDAGYIVIEAGDGEEGVAAAQSAVPDIVILDLRMPKMDGWQAIRLLKEDSRTTAIPVVVLSAFGWNYSELELESNCVAYLVKPCSASDLVSVVNAALVRSPSGAWKSSPPREK